MLADLCLELVTALNAIDNNDPRWANRWDIDLDAEPALDPATIFAQNKRGLWVVPIMTNYSLDIGNRRGSRIQTYAAMPIISVSISIPFNTFKKNDVATFEEIKEILDAREAIDNFIISSQWSRPLAQNGVNAEPAVEVELDKRWFLSITEFTFEGLRCGASP